MRQAICSRLTAPCFFVRRLNARPFRMTRQWPAPMQASIETISGGSIIGCGCATLTFGEWLRSIDPASQSRGVRGLALGRPGPGNLLRCLGLQVSGAGRVPRRLGGRLWHRLGDPARRSDRATAAGSGKELEGGPSADGASLREPSLSSRAAGPGETCTVCDRSAMLSPEVIGAHRGRMRRSGS